MNEEMTKHDFDAYHVFMKRKKCQIILINSHGFFFNILDILW